MRIIAVVTMFILVTAAFSSCKKEAVAPVKLKNVNPVVLADGPADSVRFTGGQQNPVPPPPQNN